MEPAAPAAPAPELFGRAEELGRLRTFLGHAAAGRAVLLMEGEAGIGKTALLRRLAADARSGGWRILQAAPAEAEREHAYAALMDILGSLLNTSGAQLPEPLGDDLAIALRQAPARRPPDAAAVGAATRALLELPAGSRTLVIVDDAQWLDAESEAALAFAARRTGATVSYATATRTGARPPLGLDRSPTPGSVVALRPRPLSPAAVHRLCRGLLSSPIARPTLVRVAEASGGNPFVVTELARAWGEQASMPGDAAPLLLPGSVLDLVVDRITTLSAPARQALLFVALDGRPPVRTVETALGDDARGALLEVEHASLVIEHEGRLRVAHPLLATAATSLAAGVELRAAHERLAAIVDDPVDRAPHLLAAGRHDSGTVREVAAAGELALARGASATAARLLAWARERLPAEEAAAASRLAIAEARARLAIGELSSARSLAEQAISGAPPEARAETIAALADVAWSDGTIDRELVRVRAALGSATPAVDLALRRHLVALEVAAEPAAAIEAAEAALRLVAPDADPGAAGYLTIQREMAGALAGRGVDWAALDEGIRLEGLGLRAGGSPSSPPLVLFTMTDQLARARERFVVEDAWYAARGEEGWRAERRGQLALVELRAGNVARGRQLADEAGAMLELLDEPGAWPLVGAWRALVAAHAGRADDASRLLDVAHRGLAGEAAPLWRAILASAEVFVAWVAGRDDEARSAVRRMDADAARAGVVDLLADRSEPMLASIAATHGDPIGARAALGRLERRHAALPRTWTASALPRVRALVHAAAGDTAEAIRALDAADVAAHGQLPFEHGWSLLLRGRLLRRAGSRREAAAALDEARTCFSRLDAAPWVDEAAAERRRIGLRRGDPRALTASELVIARLVASGRTTQQVAEAAFVSPKTVEANVTRIYRKLGIGSRAELGARMRDLEGEPPAQS